MLKIQNKVRRFDPTRTTMLRRRFLSEINRKLAELFTEISKLIVDEDEFGLEKRQPLVIQQQRYAFATDAQKLKAFQDWLKDMVDRGILVVSGRGTPGKPWTYEFVESAYKKGVDRAYIDTHKEALAKSPVWYAGSREQFLRTALMLPQFVSKLELLNLRVLSQLKGITTAMEQQMGRIMAEGLANGEGPLRIARNMQKAIAGLSRSRARRIARTEIIYAHAEGQLDSFSLLGVDRLGILAEWSTAGDDLVCPRCGAKEGNTYTIEEARGLIPLHPNCRCTWIPSEEQER